MIKDKRSLFFVSVLLFLFALISVTGYKVAFPKIPGLRNPQNGSVSWDVILNGPYVLKGSDGEVQLNLKINGKEFASPERSPLNLVLVIDRSGSMSERGKLVFAKEAAKAIIAGIGNEDRLSIVAYSTDVQLLLPIQYLKDKENAISVVESLYPTNSTNLSGGLIAGIDQLKSLDREGYVNRVILLSDGLANVGITNAEQLSGIIGQAAEKGIHITTMGLGLNYDEDLLMNIAEYGAGNYYFIESPMQLADIFEKEFGQLVSTVAKDSVIHLSLAPDVRIKKVFGYTYKNKDGKIRIDLGDVVSGQERNILIKLNVPTDKVGSHHLAKAYLEFREVFEGGRVFKLRREMNYEVTKSRNIVTENENKKVNARGVSVDAAYELYQAATEYEDGKANDAISKVKRALGKISELNKTPYRSDATVMQEKVLRDAFEAMEEAPDPASSTGKKIIKEYKAEAREQQK